MGEFGEGDYVRVMAVDPSTTRLGYACGEVVAGLDLTSENIVASGVVSGGSTADWLARAQHIVATVFSLANELQARRLVVEMPETWQTPRGLRSSQSGSVMKLGVVVGALWGRSLAEVPQGCFLVPVSKWKGQLPKRLCLARLRKVGLGLRLKDTEHDYNEADALGLLFWYSKHAAY